MRRNDKDKEIENSLPDMTKRFPKFNRYYNICKVCDANTKLTDGGCFRFECRKKLGLVKEKPNKSEEKLICISCGGKTKNMEGICSRFTCWKNLDKAAMWYDKYSISRKKSQEDRPVQ